jgi:hypothetical protein
MLPSMQSDLLKILLLELISLISPLKTHSSTFLDGTTSGKRVQTQEESLEKFRLTMAQQSSQSVANCMDIS